MRQRATRALGVLAMSLTAGCTFEDGRGFATLRRASLELSFEPGVRAFEGSVLTDLGYLFRVDEFVVRTEALELAGASADGGSVFDPSHPPPGYGSCHGGHCHADDGRLVPYAEIEAELAGAGDGLSEVARFEVREDMNLLAPRTVALHGAEPSNELPRAQLRQVALEASAVHVRGTCSGGPTGLDHMPFSMTLGGPTRFTGPLSLDISRDGPEELALDVTLTVGGGLFDGTDWAAHVRDESLLVDDSKSVAGQALNLALSSSELNIDTNQGEP